MARPVVALLTDFGTRDHYVGTMKGVVLGVCADAQLVDVTHDVPPQDIHAAAFELAAAYRYFPAATVFLVVVDPGVGSSRRAIAAAAGGFFFVAPDNGVLSLAFEQTPPTRLVELQDPHFALSSISATFEGRDRFAPAAGWLAGGVDLSAFGRELSDYTRIDIPRPRVDEHGVDGEVVRIDRFGNLITNIPRAMVDTFANGGVTIATMQLPATVSTYSDVPVGDVCALISSSGHLEIAVNGGNASERLRLGRGSRVRYHLRLP